MAFVYVDDGDLVSAIEFASPGHGVSGDDQVVFAGVDLFVDEADTVITKLIANGVGLVQSEDGYNTTAPDVLLALRRDGEPIDDSTELPLFFDSALVARPGYYG